MFLRTVFLIGLWLVSTAPVLGDTWSAYGGNRGGERYSALAEINRDNVAGLEVAWTYRTGEPELFGERFEHSSFESTPIIAADALIFCTPFNRLVALDPASGNEKWTFDAEVSMDNPTGMIYKCRGVTQWTDQQAAAGAACRSRIFMGTSDSRLFSVDAQTGKRCPGFGDNGEVFVAPSKELLFPGEVHFDSPPVVVNDTVVIGSSIADNQRAEGQSGRVSAYDARSGELKWRFDPIPRSADNPASKTWHDESWKTGSHANVWSILSVDEERDLVFLPTGSAAPDFFGGNRKGENRYANSLVALRGSSGELVWHFQFVHHDLWDYDLPSQPTLIDLQKDGQTIPAVVQTTKQGWVFVFNRETGESLFPIEERPTPRGAVDGEWLSPTQPFPLAPPPLVAQKLDPEDAWGFTPIDRYFCKKKIESLRNEGLYTPPSEQGTILMPSWTGGANWPGPAWHRDSGLLIVNTTRIATKVQLVPRADEAQLEGLGAEAGAALMRTEIPSPQVGTPYAMRVGYLLSPLGAPCNPPPWGGLSAVDLATGTIKWDVPLGSIDRETPIPLPFEWNLGTPNSGGPITTAGGLIFIAATMDQRFRAFDVESGEVLWKHRMPAGSQTTPMTYEANGRQYVVITSGGHAWYDTKMGDYVVAFALPE
jgi:quinoprotein glucose dehydrogenase